MSTTPNDATKLIATNSFISDIINRRGNRHGGFNNISLMESNGCKIVEPTAIEPDPNTYRGEYYYNAVTNVLYRKIITHQEPGITIAYWKRISN